MEEKNYEPSPYIKILAVYTGTKYDIQYVYRLKSMLIRNIKCAFDFICYTDNEQLVNNKKIETRLTVKKGWWGKIDIFKETGSCFFIDLDTVIVKDMTNFIEAIDKVPDDTILMLDPWTRREGWASGLMAWNGDFKFIHEQFKNSDSDKFRWDQRYISYIVKENKKNIESIKNYYLTYCSYKKHCRDFNDEVPEGVEIVCFHGKPNPHEVMNISWVKDNWK